jgi:undecaprenyl-diphosphatase
LGTLAALLSYFFPDWLAMARAVIRPTPFNRQDRRLFISLVLACIPGALAGVFLEHQAETIFRHPARIALLLGAMGIVLIVAERVSRRHRPLANLRLGDAFLIGLSQALAIMPGVSRSGVTMTCALFLGFTRETSARFSFLLATPIIAGAGIFHLPKWFKSPPEDLSVLAGALGFAAAVVSSYLTIKYLLRFLRSHTFLPFAVYRLLLASLILALNLLY